MNLVLEFVPETIYRIIKHYSRTKRQVPGLYVKVGALLLPFTCPVPGCILLSHLRHLLDPLPMACACACSWLLFLFACVARERASLRAPLSPVLPSPPHARSLLLRRGEILTLDARGSSTCTKWRDR